MSEYTPLTITTIEGPYGIQSAKRAVRLPFNGKGISTDKNLFDKLVRRGDDHAKAVRGIIVYAELKMQVGFMIELETYRIGIEVLSTSSSMHNELRDLTGIELAEKKQNDLPEKVYTRVIMVSYQTLRRIWKARRKHKHPDFQIFCDWIESLPYFDEFIVPEVGE